MPTTTPPGVYDLPETREVVPGHLVRSGLTSAYDANFGKQAGAAAVKLLQAGIGGVTVVGVRSDGTVHNMPTAEAIKQRHVDTGLISLYEDLGLCFGRKAESLSPTLVADSGEPERSF